MIADLLQRAAVIYFHFNSDADIRGGERHSAIRHAEPFPWWRFYMRYIKLFFVLVDSVAGALRSAHDEICFG